MPAVPWPGQDCMKVIIFTKARVATMLLRYAVAQHCSRHCACLMEAQPTSAGKMRMQQPEILFADREDEEGPLTVQYVCTGTPVILLVFRRLLDGLQYICIQIILLRHSLLTSCTSFLSILALKGGWLEAQREPLLLFIHAQHHCAHACAHNHFSEASQMNLNDAVKRLEVSQSHMDHPTAHTRQQNEQSPGQKSASDNTAAVIASSLEEEHSYLNQMKRGQNAT